MVAQIVRLGPYRLHHILRPSSAAIKIPSFYLAFSEQGLVYWFVSLFANTAIVAVSTSNISRFYDGLLMPVVLVIEIAVAGRIFRSAHNTSHRAATSQRQDMSVKRPANHEAGDDRLNSCNRGLCIGGPLIWGNREESIQFRRMPSAKQASWLDAEEVLKTIVEESPKIP